MRTNSSSRAERRIRAAEPERVTPVEPAVERVLALQRSAGNQAVGRMLQRVVVPKGGSEEQRFAELMSRWKQLNNPTITWSKAVAIADTLEELEQLLVEEESREAAPQQKGKKKKPVPMSLGDFQAAVPVKKAWSAGAKTGLDVVTTGKKIEAPASKPVTLDSRLTAAEAEAGEPETNAPIVRLIQGGKKAKPERFAAHMREHDQIEAETVYLPMTIYVRDGPLDAAFKVYLHYHPKPNTKNWLHVKRTKAATPEHRVDLGWWFVNRQLMEAAHRAWQDLYGTGGTVIPPWDK